MADSREADAAIKALNGMELDGRALNVNIAKPKTERSGGNGGGFRGGRSNNRW